MVFELDMIDEFNRFEGIIFFNGFLLGFVINVQFGKVNFGWQIVQFDFFGVEYMYFIDFFDKEMFVFCLMVGGSVEFIVLKFIGRGVVFKSIQFRMVFGQFVVGGNLKMAFFIWEQVIGYIIGQFILCCNCFEGFGMCV